MFDSSKPMTLHRHTGCDSAKELFQVVWTWGEVGVLSSAFCALEVGDRRLLRREAHSVCWGTLEMVGVLRAPRSHILWSVK